MIASSGAAALANLESVPDLPTLGLEFAALADDPTGGIHGFSITLGTEAQSELSHIAQTTRTRFASATMLAYGPTVLIAPQHAMYVATAEAAMVNETEKTMDNHDFTPLTSKVTSQTRIRMLAARFTGTNPEHTITFYRIADSLLQLKQSKLLGLIQQNGVYNRLDPADVLLLRADFDVMVISGYAFFTKKSTFERGFGFLDALQKQSLSTFEAVTASLNIEGIDSLRSACTQQTQMMSKMSSIKRSMDSDPAYAAAMTMPKLVAYVQQHPHIDIEIVGQGSAMRLVFDPSPARRFQILKLLDDDFLRSVLTEREYEAGSKVQTSTN